MQIPIDVDTIEAGVSGTPDRFGNPIREKKKKKEEKAPIHSLLASAGDSISFRNWNFARFATDFVLNLAGSLIKLLTRMESRKNGHFRFLAV